MHKIAIIEDDSILSGILAQTLQKYGYTAIIADDFNNIENQLQKTMPDIILLDINLPQFDGFHLCRSIRKFSKAPILILSARSGEMEQIMGMELGADDYMTKPFKMDVLLAKIKSLLRRSYGEYSDTNTILVKGLHLDEGTFRLEYRSKTAELSKNEFRMMKLFLTSVNRLVSREELLEELWDSASFVDDNTLTVNITRLRDKLEELGLKDVIRTKRGAGYVFDTENLRD